VREPEREALLVRVYEHHWNEFRPNKEQGTKKKKAADLMYIADGALAQARIEERLIGRRLASGGEAQSQNARK
jgi:hypothetical protein